MAINFIKNGKENKIRIDTNDNITIKYFTNLISIRTQVTDFVSFISHCRYGSKYPYFIKIPEVESSYYHSQLEHYNNDDRVHTLKFRDVHQIEKIKEISNNKIPYFDYREFCRALPSIEEDIINIPREGIYSRLSTINKKNVELILVGRPDKVLRVGKNLIVEEDKPGNLFDYAYNPFAFHILQAATYIKSKFSYMFRPTCGKVGRCDASKYVGQRTISEAWLNEPVIVNDYDRDNNDFIDIHHQKKILKIIIKDPKFSPNIEKNTVAIFQKEYDDNIEKFLYANISVFMTMITSSIHGNHFDNFNKCNLCSYISCPIRLIRHNIYRRV